MEKTTIPHQTVCLWYLHCEKIGELPCVTKEFFKKLEGRGNKYQTTTYWEQSHVDALKEVVDENP